uniref:Uncharacterized protein n=1 Tax=Arundo donax TaxID=35708 RepID=A0A0A9DJ03_ARUDO
MSLMLIMLIPCSQFGSGATLGISEMNDQSLESSADDGHPE